MKWGKWILKELEPITPSYEDNPNETLYAEVKEAIHKLKKKTEVQGPMKSQQKSFKLEVNNFSNVELVNSLRIN
jgi:hypothetical protein